MRTFTIVPTNARARPVTLNAFDDTAVLHGAERFSFEDAAVYEAGAYKYSLRHEGGVWCIYMRTEPP